MLAISNSRSPVLCEPRRNRGLRAGWLLCFLATLAAAPALGATTVTVTSASVARDDGLYEFDAALDIGLPGGARRAIDGGLTLRLDYEIEIARVRRYMPDAGLAAIVQSFELNYHALSQRYLVRNLNTGEQQDFGTVEAALDRMSELRGLPLVDASLLEPDARYEFRVRAVLDLRTAPDVLAWLLFWTDDWNATSDWYAWTLPP
jgi:hypothetical protein